MISRAVKADGTPAYRLQHCYLQLLRSGARFESSKIVLHICEYLLDF